MEFLTTIKKGEKNEAMFKVDEACMSFGRYCFHCAIGAASIACRRGNIENPVGLSPRRSFHGPAEGVCRRRREKQQWTAYGEGLRGPGDRAHGTAVRRDPPPPPPTKRGVVQMLQGAGVIWQGIMPASNIEFGLPMAYRIKGVTDFEEQARIVREFFYKDGFAELLRKEYAKHGLYLLDIHTYGPVPFVLATKPYKTCDDLKGKKIRTDGLNHAFHGGVGMQGASISGLETYMALKLGTVDAAEWDVSAVTGLKWHEVAPYWIRGFENDQCLGHILVNLKTWNGLSPENKKALEAAGEAYWHATVKGYKQEMEAVQGLIQEGKLTEIWLDQPCQDAYAKVAHELWDQAAKEDETSAELVGILKKWHGIK